MAMMIIIALVKGSSVLRIEAVALMVPSRTKLERRRCRDFPFLNLNVTLYDFGNVGGKFLVKIAKTNFLFCDLIRSI